MKFLKLALAGAAASLALGGAAYAQDEGGAEVSFNVGAATDYVFRGVSQTDGPQIFGGVDITGGPLYAGAWVSNVDFGDSTNAEIDLYAGAKGELGPVAVDAAVIYYAYSGAPSGTDYDYLEFKLAGSIPAGPATLGAAVYYSPEFFGGIGSAVYYEANAAIPVAEKWTISGAIGEQTFDIGGDYTTYNIGVAWQAFEKVGFDLRFHDSDLSCGTYCDSRVVLSVKAVLP